jgi:hypothetical protein
MSLQLLPVVNDKLLLVSLIIRKTVTFLVMGQRPAFKISLRRSRAVKDLWFSEAGDMSRP